MKTVLLYCATEGSTVEFAFIAGSWINERLSYTITAPDGSVILDEAAPSYSTGDIMASVITEQGVSDCDDNMMSVNPDAVDLVGDGVDQNCDDVDGTDGDMDGYAGTASGGEDCDDADAGVNPGALTMYADADGDGFGGSTMVSECDEDATMDSSDCDDMDANTFPGAAYAQSATECLTDADGDGWSTTGSTCYNIDMADSYGDGWNGNGNYCL